MTSSLIPGLLEFDDILGSGKLNGSNIFPINNGGGIFQERSFLNNHSDGFFTEPGIFHINNFLDAEGRSFNGFFPDHNLDRGVADTGFF